ncbi:IGR protein motif-domain-containing protein [Xylariales sp. PMI_506]|nr:IGR protein motif-domain-containing protein [Xylariales sp. PMI_506]
MGAFKHMARLQTLRPLLNNSQIAGSSILYSRPAAAAAVTSIRARLLTTTPARPAPGGASSAPAPPAIPEPTPFVPDVQTFLKLIGRGLTSHASKFPTWESFFSLTSEQMKELGVEPARTRRYLIWWRQRFAAGHFGPGGDMKHVTDGVASLQVLEDHPRPGEAPRRYVVNVPQGKTVRETAPEDLIRVSGYTVKAKSKIVGPHALPLKKGGATVSAIADMWMVKQPPKINGGERRRTMVLYKKRIQERREMRERGEIP